jgi:hypothetical protein
MRAALRAAGVSTPDAFLGDAARRPAWTEEALCRALAALPDGVTELMAHPGYRPALARTSFGVEREEELRALTSARARAALEASGALACSFADAWDPDAGGAPGAA